MAAAETMPRKTLVLNLHRDYAEASGSEVDVMAAFADAVSFVGGPLAHDCDMTAQVRSSASEAVVAAFAQQ